MKSERTELDVLNELVETCRDGEHGFRFASEHATDPDLRALFATLAGERERFAEELAPHLHRLGGQANTAGSTAGVIHRGWMSLKDKVFSHDDEALLTEAERGDRAAVRVYEDALHGMLPPTASELIETQLAAIRNAHARMVALAKAREVAQ